MIGKRFASHYHQKGRCFRLTLFIGLSLFSILLTVPTPSIVYADAQSPSSTIAVGDWWTYNLVNAGVGITGSVTMTLTSIVTLLVNGVSTSAYKETTTGSGNLAKNGVTGTFTTTGTGYVRQSDLASINDNLTVVFNAGFTFTQITYTNTSTPVVPAEFPLYVGKTWVHRYTTTTQQTTFTSINPTPVVKTFNNNTAQVYTVASSSIVSVDAGSYLAYQIHSTNATGNEDQYYSPQVDNLIKDVSYYPNGTVQSTITLHDFSAWAYQSTLNVSHNGGSYNVGLMADATISNQSSNSTAINFQVNGTSGTSGRANVAIPTTLNNTVVKVYVDSSLVTVTSSKNSTYYQLFFTFGLTTHTIALLYTASPAASWTSYLIYGGIAAAAIALVIAALLILRRRTQPPVGPSTTTSPYPPSPSTTPPEPTS